MSATIPTPAHLQPYVRILGQDLAVTFLLEFGGAELYLAINPKGRSKVAHVVGVENARKLANTPELLPRRVPTGKKWIAQVFYMQGLTVAEIARRLHSSDVSVRTWVGAAKSASNRPDPRQQSLF